MDDLTSPHGSIALAISALLLVVGYRLARPARGAEWLAVGAYAAALVVLLVGARGVLPGGAIAAGPALRVGGALLLACGLLVAGAPARARRRAASSGSSGPPRLAGAAYAGLALVLVGQLARAPSAGGAAAAGLAAVVCLAVAAIPRRRGAVT